MQGKPVAVGIPPTYPPRVHLIREFVCLRPTVCCSRTNRLLLLARCSVNNATLRDVALCRRHRPSDCHANYKVREGGRFCQQNWLPQCNVP